MQNNRNENMDKKTEAKLKKYVTYLTHDRFSLQGMTRILLKCQRDDFDIKSYDIETLMIEILRKTIKMRSEINVLNKILKIQHR